MRLSNETQWSSLLLSRVSSFRILRRYHTFQVRISFTQSANCVIVISTVGLLPMNAIQSYLVVPDPTRMNRFVICLNA